MCCHEYHHHANGLVEVIGPQHGGDIGPLEDGSPYSSSLVNLLLELSSCSATGAFPHSLDVYLLP